MRYSLRFVERSPRPWWIVGLSPLRVLYRLADADARYAAQILSNLNQSQKGGDAEPNGLIALK